MAAPEVDDGAGLNGRIAAVARGAGLLASVRGRPCLVAIAPTIERRVAAEVWAAIAEARGSAVDVVLYSHGGAIDAAYVMARDLRRRFSEVTVFVPLCAKSAAALIAVAADELVLGHWGELGPLDAQFQPSGLAESGESCSELAHVKALERLDECSGRLFEAVARYATPALGLAPAEAASEAAAMVAGLREAIYSRIDPLRIGQAALALEVAEEYLRRLLGRYHPHISEERAVGIARQLVYGYPSHGFVLDLEELGQIGLPARAPNEAEGEALESILVALLPHDDALEITELIGPPAKPVGRAADHGDDKEGAEDAQDAAGSRPLGGETVSSLLLEQP